MGLVTNSYKVRHKTCFRSGETPGKKTEGLRPVKIDFFADYLVKWLGDLDSNQDSQIQNLESYRWTISHPLRRKRVVSHFQNKCQL